MTDNKTANGSSTTMEPSEEELEKEGPHFDPPVYIQRYNAVRDILYKEPGIIRVVDFGCADGKFLRYLKKLPFAEEISIVDINTTGCLDYAVRIAQPLAWDFLFPRHRPLTVKVFEGSVADHDSRVKGFDAVTCIELIEHLTSDALKKFPENIFGYIKPKIVIITTPNSEFNVLFPRLKGFRHWDHKFEWTRDEFALWCQQVTDSYPEYVVSYTGVGEAIETPSIGFCTQIAVFRRCPSKRTVAALVTSTEEILSYELVGKYEYPGRTANAAGAENTSET